MVSTKTKKTRVLRIILIAVIVILCALLFLASNILFEFALNPDSSFFMGKLLSTGQTEANEGSTPAPELSEATQQWWEYYTLANAWFHEDAEETTLISHDGLTLRAYQFRKENSHRYVIVCHGYGGDPTQMSGYAMRFYEMGCSVLVPAARAHGNSDGDYIGMGWLERKDMLGWIDQIITEDSQAEIALFGVSMGGATVMMTAGETLPEQVKCIIEDCGYSSVWDEFSLQLQTMFGAPDFPLLHTSGLVCKIRAGYCFKEASSIEQLKKAEVPMLFIHGEADTFVPYSMLDPVYEACASKEKQKLSIPNAAHGAAAATDPELYWNTVDTFISTYLA